MKQQIYLFSLLLHLPLIAENIGDFAPLEVGNMWVYNVSEKSSTAPVISSIVTSTIDTIIVTDLYRISDTIYYRLKGTRTGIKITQEGNDVPPETLVVASSGFSTIFEVDDTIGYGTSRYVYSKPVLWTHYINSDMLPGSPDFPPCSLNRVNDGYELVYQYYVTGPVKIIYRADIGLIYESFQDGTTEGFYTRRSETTLVSFSKNNIVANRVWRTRERQAVSPHVAGPECSLTLPHLAITRDSKTFNLLGKMFPRSSTPPSDVHRYDSRRTRRHY